MNIRFSSNSCSVLRGVCALNPKHSAFLDKKALPGMAANCDVVEDGLAMEINHLKRLIVRKTEQRQEIFTPMEFEIMLEPYKDVFIDLYKLARIAVTLPVICLREEFLMSEAFEEILVKQQGQQAHLATLLSSQ